MAIVPSPEYHKWRSWPLPRSASQPEPPKVEFDGPGDRPGLSPQQPRPVPPANPSRGVPGSFIWRKRQFCRVLEVGDRLFQSMPASAGVKSA